MTYVGAGFSRTYISVVVATMLTAAAIKPAALQNPPQPPQTTFRTEVNYVRVDAYPTRDGAPVLDLTQQDFEILESGVPQKIEQFERVLIRPAGPQDTRIEPNTVAESRSMAQNPRARVFVVFLDTYHVDVAASHNIRGPLIEALDRMIGAEDLVAVMTPEMSASDITFARKTTTIAGFLTRHWDWGDRNKAIPRDPIDLDYGTCYPNDRDTTGIAAEMIDRRHEKLSLDALHDLVVHLGGLREERKAVLTISNGWLLYRPDLNLMRQLGGRVPTGPVVGVEPRGGKLTTKDRSDAPAANNRCELDRVNLAQIDDELDYRRLLDRANTSNVSFYPVDARGLAVFDTPIMRQDVPGKPPPPVPLVVDRAMLTARLTSLRTLAENTDGIAIVDTNDLAKGFRRVVDDLSSYYLIGYYSSGKLDGRFHSITVRVKRPGVQVRARRGYLAATPAEMTAATRPAAPPKLVEAETAAIQTALASLTEIQRDSPLRIHVATGWRPFDSRVSSSSNAELAQGRLVNAVAGFWVVAEFAASAPPDRDVDVTVVSSAGATVGRATGAGGTRNVMVPVVLSESAAGEFTVRVRAEGFGTGTVRVTLPPAPDAGGAIFLRRGPTTGNKDVPTADLRFRRNERLRIDLPFDSPDADGLAQGRPGADASTGTARILDRTGKALPIPLTATVRDDRDGSRWQSTEFALAPLAPGDYLIEMTTGGAKTLAAFRIVP
jgi:VWFA-related protein